MRRPSGRSSTQSVPNPVGSLHSLSNEAPDPRHASVDSEGASLLSVKDLGVEFETELGRIEVVRGVGFDVGAGSTVGLVGESGSGKSVTARAILGLTGSRGRICNGHVFLNGRDLTSLPARELRMVRGREIAMIFQEPRRSLDPAFTVGSQVAEVARHSLGLSRKVAWTRAVELLELVQIAEPAKRARHYPHQFSGGMCQRVMLAIALAGDPSLLIADEPTTALDVTVQAHVLELIRSLQGEFDLGVLFITHDLGVVAEMCDRAVVMYAGEVVEDAPVTSIFRNPAHPYTQALLESLPQLANVRLSRIEGTIPSPYNWPSGCRFRPRCQHRVEKCSSEPPMIVVDESHCSRCFRIGEVELGGIG